MESDLASSKEKDQGPTPICRLRPLDAVLSSGLCGKEGALPIGAKPNLYCEAIELVCGSSPKVCVLVERKALDRVKSEL